MSFVAKASRWMGSLGLLALYGVSVFSLAGHETPDSSWPFYKWAGVLGLALVSSYIVYALGRKLTQALGWAEESLAFPLGSAALALFYFALAVSHAVGFHSPAYVLTLALLAVVALKPEPLPKIAWPLWPVLVLLTALALFPQSNPDPLYYHLLSIERWYEAGHLYFAVDHPLLFQSGIWEHLYFLPWHLLSPIPTQNILALHVVAQLLVLWIGFSGCYLLWNRVLERFGFRDSALWALVIVLEPKLLDIAVTAKNDWGILLWASAAIFLLLEKNKLARVLSAFLLGLALASKWSASLGFLPLLCVLLWEGRNELLLIFPSLFAGLAPILLRNWFAIRAPFFPALAQASLAPADIVLFSELARPWHVVNIRAVGLRAAELFAFNPLHLFWALFPFYFKKLPRLLLGGTVVAALASLFLFHAALSIRLAGPLLPLLSLGALLIAREGRYEKVLVGLGIASVASAVFCFLPSITAPSEPALMLRQFPAGDAMAWLRMNSKPGEVNAFAGNAELYYMSGFPSIDVDMGLRVSRKLEAETTFSGIVRALRRGDCRWLVETANPIPRGRTAGFFAAFARSRSAENMREYMPFSGLYGRVWDLVALEKLVNSPGFQDPPHESKGYLLQEQH